MDWASFKDLRRGVMNPVSVEVRDPNGKLKAVRYTHNLRTNAGGDWQAMTMAGFTVASSNYNGQARVLTASVGATSLTDTSASPAFNANSANNVKGRMVVVSDGTSTNTAMGFITNAATSSVLTIDKWHTIGSTSDATATTPSGAALAYAVLPSMAPAWYIALSTDSTAPAAGDTSLTGEVSTNGMTRSFASTTWTHTSPVGASQQNTVYTIANTFTATGTTTALQKCGMFTAIVSGGGANSGVMAFENTFGSTTVNNNDTITINWQVTA